MILCDYSQTIFSIMKSISDKGSLLINTLSFITPVVINGHKTTLH